MGRVSGVTLNNIKVMFRSRYKDIFDLVVCSSKLHHANPHRKNIVKFHTVHCSVPSINQPCHSVTPLKLPSCTTCLSNINQEICDVTFCYDCSQRLKDERLLVTKACCDSDNKTKPNNEAQNCEMIGTSSLKTLRCRLSYSHSLPSLNVMAY